MQDLCAIKSNVLFSKNVLKTLLQTEETHNTAIIQVKLAAGGSWRARASHESLYVSSISDQTLK